MRKATTVKPIMWRKWKRKKFPPDVRLLFSFLLSGEGTNLSGLVTYSIDEMSGFTGLSEEKTRGAMAFLVDSGRVLWDEENDLILLVRWIKHNPLNSPKLEMGARNSLLPYENHPFREIAVSLLSGADPDRVSIGYRQGMDTLQGQGQGQVLNVLKKSLQKTDTEIGRKIKELTALFVDLIRANDPQARVPGILDPWEAEIGRIHFRDGRTFGQIEEVIRFSQTGFWAPVVLSPRDLADKFPRMLLTIKRDQAGGRHRGFDGPDNRGERNREVMEKKLKELENEGNCQSIDGGRCDIQRAIECGPAERVSGDPERLPD